MGHPNPGSRVSHYQLVRKLGSGGMGDVFLARDLQLERPVAIKFLNAPTDEHSRHRLLKEAKAAASLDHPFICAVYEVGSDETSGDFIVMQYVEGETLAARLSRGALTPDDTLTLAGEVAEALAAAHQHGIVHRDLKPLNIVMQPSGRPKLLDFGISKRVASPHDAAEAATETQLTGPHAMIGTPGYMAPEQIQGKPADYRTDLFALGCVLYECITGRRAFAGVTSGEVFGEVLHKEPPPVSSLLPAATPEMDAFISRLLRKSPGERFQSADEVLGAIRTLRGQTTGTGQRVTLGTATGPALRPRPSWLVVTAAVVALVVAVVAGVTWWRRGALPVPPPDVVRWYDQGVEALRAGTYAEARAALEEAVRLFPAYAQAYSRLADAYTELDDNDAAQRALLRVATIVPDITRLPRDERLRLEAAQAMVLREHERAIGALLSLVDRHPEDAGLVLDLGRAHEAAGQMGVARDCYAKAVELDAQYAAAHLRMGIAEGQAGDPARALAGFDEAIRLYKAASRIEGEAEALLRKGFRQNATGDFAGARLSLERAGEISRDRYQSQHLRSRFQLARVTMAEGRFQESEQMAADAVAEATAGGLDRFAADGLIDLANTLVALRRYDDANAALERAIQLATKERATRTEMRARLQQASVRLETGDAQEAIALAEVPTRFFAEGRYRQLEAQGKTIVSRAREYLEQYDEAQRLATEALQYAESIGNNALVTGSLENLAGQLTKQGRLPDALRHRERSEQIHRTQGNHASLRFDLPNRAELLIRLGRGREAEALLVEIQHSMAAGNSAYVGLGPRVARLQALLASTEGRWADVEAYVEALIKPSATPDGAMLTAMVLREHARARLGRSREAPSTIAAWLDSITSPPVRRELAYWVALTLLARKEPDLALSVVSTELSAPPLQGNVELRWRLNALAVRAVEAGATPSDRSDLRTQISEDVGRLNMEWGGDATAYFARPDLAQLRRFTQGATDGQ